LIWDHLEYLKHQRCCLSLRLVPNSLLSSFCRCKTFQLLLLLLLLLLLQLQGCRAAEQPGTSPVASGNLL
jgi:hypothetical protein